MKPIVWFKDIDKNSISIAGGKAAHLAEMTRARFPVPPGFVVTTEAYAQFLSKGLKHAIEQYLKTLNVDDTQKLQLIAQQIQQLILRTPIPDEIKEAIVDSYDVLGADDKKDANIFMQGSGEFVAVRSSATAEDMPDASFAGQQATYLNVRGSSNVVKAVQACWASLFTSRAIFYRAKKGYADALIAVVVQQMVNSDAAGVMFMVNPVNHDAQEIVIEAALGLGESVVSGSVTPDYYLIDKSTGQIKKAEAKIQGYKLARDTDGKTIKQKLFPADDKLRVLTDRHIGELVRIGKKIEQHYQSPQDIEWAIEKEQVYVVQTRPITTLEKSQQVTEVKEEKQAVPESSGQILVRGHTASRGQAQGVVRVISHARELAKVNDGDILVTRTTNPDMVPALQKAAAIVTDEGGATSHAAIVSRELGIPCIVGTSNATKVLQDGMTVTVDGYGGVVYPGKVRISSAVDDAPVVSSSQTKTKVKVIMDFPSHAERIAKTNADGVGLLRLEFVIASNGIHPAHYIRENKDDEYTELLVREIGMAARAFAGKPIWARTSDLRSDEYRNLKGGHKEPEETDPMIGWHGIRRSLDEPRILQAEFRAIKKLHEQGHRNVGIMIPFVIHPDEVRKAKELCRNIGLEPQKDVAFGVMLETPAACLVIDDICKEGIDFVSFGTNDLTQLSLGVDRNNHRIQKHYNELHPAVLSLIGHAIDVCRKHNVETSICGQAGSKEAMAEFLVRHGVDSISANPDAVHKVREVVAAVEKKVR